MPKFLFLLFILSSILSCQISHDQDFQKLHTDFQEKVKQQPLFEAFSEQQLFIDSTLIILKKGEAQQVLNYSKHQLKQLNSFEKEKLDSKFHKNYDDLHVYLNTIIKNIELDKIHIKNPSFYYNLPYLKSLIQLRNVEQLSDGLSKLNLHYQTAIEHLNNPNTEQLDNIVTEGIAGYEFMTNEVKAHLLSLKLEKEKEQILLVKLSETQLDIKNYIAFCNSQLFEAQN